MLTILREKKLTCFSLGQGYTKIMFIIYICTFIIQRQKVGEGERGCSRQISDTWSPPKNRVSWQKGLTRTIPVSL